MINILIINGKKLLKTRNKRSHFFMRIANKEGFWLYGKEYYENNNYI